MLELQFQNNQSAQIHATDLPDVGQPATRLRPGDRVSRASTDQTERAHGVVTARSGISYVTIHYDADPRPERTEWGDLRLEKLGLMWEEPPRLLLQRPRETDNRFKSRRIHEIRCRTEDAINAARPPAARAGDLARASAFGRSRARARARTAAQGRARAPPPAAFPPGAFRPLSEPAALQHQSRPEQPGNEAGARIASGAAHSATEPQGRGRPHEHTLPPPSVFLPGQRVCLSAQAAGAPACDLK